MIGDFLEILIKQLESKLRWFSENGILKFLKGEIANVGIAINGKVRDLLDSAEFKKLIKHTRKIKNEANVRGIDIPEIDGVLNLSSIFQLIINESDIKNKIARIKALIQNMENLLIKKVKEEEVAKEKRIKEDEYDKFIAELREQLKIFLRKLEESFKAENARYELLDKLAKVYIGISECSDRIQKRISSLTSGFVEVLDSLGIDRQIVKFSFHDLVGDIQISVNRVADTIQSLDEQHLKQAEPGQVVTSLETEMMVQMEGRLKQIEEIARSAPVKIVEDHLKEVDKQIKIVRKAYKEFLAKNKQELLGMAGDVLHRQELKLQEVEFEKHLGDLRREYTQLHIEKEEQSKNTISSSP